MRRVRDALAARPALVDWLVLVVAVALPCRYLVPLGSDYYVDWSNHQWSIGYAAAYFAHHGAMPGVVHTRELAGLAVPVFYGNLFYPVLGAIARVTSAGLAIRLGVVVLYALQFRLVDVALRRAGAPRRWARGVACLVIWAIYPLTNLYNRGALTELFATGLLVCALALLVLVCCAEHAGPRRRYASAMLLALTLAAGTHPITALLGVPVFAALAVVFGWLVRADRARLRAIAIALVPWLVLAALCTAPWLYATLGYADHLAIRHAVPDVVFFPDAIDAWSTRFSPLPSDPRVADGVALGKVSTPYLDAQVNLALGLATGVLAAAALGATRGRPARRALWIVLAVAGVLFAGFTAMSLIPATYHALPGLMATIQFAYRAVTYQNLALLAAGLLIVLASAAPAPADARSPSSASAVDVPGAPATPAGGASATGSPTLAAWLARPAARAALAGCLVLALAGVIVKWRHIAAVQRASAPADLLHLPDQYYGAADYATEDLFTPLGDAPAEPRSFEIDAETRFGQPRTLTVELAAPTWIATNVQSFPWNALAIDDTRATASEVRTSGARLAVHVPAGHHKLTLRFAPPLAWRVLRTASLLGVALWLLGTLVELGLGLRARRRRAARVVE